MISPSDLGLPAKFPSWWSGQEQIITSMAYCTKRYDVEVIPMGGGKTACYIATALLNRGRTLILTSTKGLMDQVALDMGNLVTVVKGQSTYKCKLSEEKYWCNTGSCHWGYECLHKIKGDCHYRMAIAKANKAKIVLTNYSFWMSNVPEVLGDFSLLVMDEAHDAADHLMSALSIEIRRDEVTGIMRWPEKSVTSSDCYTWARVLKGLVDDLSKKGKRSGRGHYKLLALQQKLQTLDKMWVSNWVVEHKGNSISWDVIWPASLAQGYLFRGIPKVILTSATVTKADTAMLGIKADEMTHREYPSTFPVLNRLIYLLPVVRMDMKITNEGMNAWAAAIDNIIRSRFGYKGLIHTASYERANRVCNFSAYKDFMIGHDSKSTMSAVAEFKKSDPPRILVSPSVSTGYDFPGQEANWQIIGKVPFPDSRPLVMKARQRVNPDYGCHMAIKQLIQASGRIVRSRTDVGETFVIDAHLKWVVGKYRGIIPKWWMDSLRTITTIPVAR